MEIINGSNHIAYHLPVIGQQLVVPDLKKSAITDTHLVHISKAITSAVTALEEEAEKLAKNSFLSIDGRRDRLAKTQAELAERVKDLARVLDGHRGQALHDERALFAVPQLDRADAATAVEEVELRRWFGEQTLEQKTKLATEMQTGNHPELLLALRRSKVPSFDKTLGESTWEVLLERTRGDELDDIRARQEAVERVQVTLTMAGKIASAKPAFAPAGR